MSIELTRVPWDGEPPIFGDFREKVSEKCECIRFQPGVWIVTRRDDPGRRSPVGLGDGERFTPFAFDNLCRNLGLDPADYLEFKAKGNC